MAKTKGVRKTNYTRSDGTKFKSRTKITKGGKTIKTTKVKAKNGTKTKSRSYSEGSVMKSYQMKRKTGSGATRKVSKSGQSRNPRGKTRG
jgi:hypothetical protein